MPGLSIGGSILLLALICLGVYLTMRRCRLSHTHSHARANAESDLHAEVAMLRAEVEELRAMRNPGVNASRSGTLIRSPPPSYAYELQ